MLEQAPPGASPPPGPPRRHRLMTQDLHVPLIISAPGRLPRRTRLDTPVRLLRGPASPRPPAAVTPRALSLARWSSSTSSRHSSTSPASRRPPRSRCRGARSRARCAARSRARASSSTASAASTRSRRLEKRAHCRATRRSPFAPSSTLRTSLGASCSGFIVSLTITLSTLKTRSGSGASESACAPADGRRRCGEGRAAPWRGCARARRGRRRRRADSRAAARGPRDSGPIRISDVP